MILKTLNLHGKKLSTYFNLSENSYFNSISKNYLLRICFSAKFQNRKLFINKEERKYYG